MNQKNGFTISELLMSIAIISIVSAMGMTIAKRGTEDAYKNYFAVGTMNLNNALAQIETGDVNVQVINNKLEKIGQVADLQRIMTQPGLLTNSLKFLFNDDAPILNQCRSDRDKADYCTIDTKNGITYEINTVDGFQDPNNTFRIVMFVPAPRTRQNPDGRLWTEFIYLRRAFFEDLEDDHPLAALNNLGNISGGMLVPLNQDVTILRGIRDDFAVARFVSLQDRQDLLTAYIDDGIVGRHVPRYNADGSINHYDFLPIRYGTFRDAFCTLTDQENLLLQNDSVLVKCTANNDNPNFPQNTPMDVSPQNVNQPGVIKFASPRKLK